MYSLWDFFLQKTRFTYLLILGCVVFGLFSLSAIPKESAPEVQIPVAIISTVFPGASAVDVEELVTDKIEEGLQNGLENVNKITSSSRESISVISVEFDADADLDSSIQDTKDEVDKVKAKLPADAEDPVVSEVNFVDQPIILISISSDLPAPEFILLAEEVSREIKKVAGVSRVEKSGIEDREVQVVVDKEKLHAYGFSLGQVIQNLALSNASLPVGSITFDGIEYSIGFEGDIENTEDVRNIAIGVFSGKPVYVRDIAFVSDGVSKPRTFSRISLGGNDSEQAVTLSVFKRGGGDVTKITENVRNRVDALKTGILSNSSVLVSFDTGELVKLDLTNLTEVGLETISLVVIVLLLTLGWREAVVAGLAIPLTILLAFVGLYLSGNTINFVSLFALILAVGILVDSAVVVTEGVHTHINRGLSLFAAARQSVRDFAWPLISGTMTTVAVFVPLFFISGVTGQFIASIPFTIIFVLLASQFISLAITPLLAAKFLKIQEAHIGETAEDRVERYTGRFREWYRAKLTTLLSTPAHGKKFLRYLVLGFILALALPITGLVKTEFFPQEDIDFIILTIEKEEGTTLSETDLSVRAVEEILYKEPRIESFVTTVGAGSSFLEGSGSGPKYGNITVILPKAGERDYTSTEVVETLRNEMKLITSAKVGVFQPNNGPPVGAPVLIKFFGENLEDLERAVVRAERILKVVPGAAEVQHSMRNNNTGFVLSIDKAKAAEAGLSPLVIAQTLRTAIYGVSATSIKEGGEDVDVVVKLNLNSDYKTPHDTNRVTVDALRQIEIPTPRGSVLLGSLMDVRLDQTSSSIEHEERKRIATVSSQVSVGYSAGEILAGFLERKDELEIPPGVEMSIGGENEEVNKSFRDMFVALFAGLVLVAAILILQFNSFRHATYLILTVPFSLIGVFLGLFLTGKALSFPSMMGFIALAGVIVNHSILLIDKVNVIRKENPSAPLNEVIIEGSVSRLRPITLTNLTTIIGMIPLSFSSDLWGPLAYTIMSGLAFSFVLTLGLVPLLYHRSPGKAETENTL